MVAARDYPALNKQMFIMKTKSRPRAKPQGGGQTLRIEFHGARAQAVSIAGTFNDWRPGTTPMLHVGEGRWVKGLSLPPGRYEYRLVVTEPVQSLWLIELRATKGGGHSH